MGARWPAAARWTQHTILACARTKLAVVAADERDAGRRQVLNLGHTVGHAIETATGYGRYRHGEAVGLGLLAALRLSGLDSLRAQVRELLRGPRAAGDARRRRRWTTCVQATRARQEARRLATCRSCSSRRPGDVRIGCEVAADELRAAVAELLR